MRIHPEGWTFLGGLAVLLAGGAWLLSRQWPASWWAFSLPAVLIFLFFLQFFRHPHRPIAEPDNRRVYAPADGKIVAIERVEERKHLHSSCIQLSIFMSIVNVHANRVPIAATVEALEHHPGKYLVAWHPKSSAENEQTHIVLNTGTHRILLRQIAGAVARRIKTYIAAGQRVEQGEELGFIKFGSRVDILLPPEAEIRTAIGQEVRANVDVLAELPD